MKTKLYILVLILISTIVLNTNISAQQGEFEGTNLGPIPDGAGQGPANYGDERKIFFNVSGLSNVYYIDVTFAAEHTFVGDLRVKLRAPNGVEHILFERTGATTAGSAGSASNLSLSTPYGFSDRYPNDWWFAASGGGDIPSGEGYRTTVPGGAGVPNPAPATSMTNTFRGVPANGQWELIFQDGWNGDTGNVGAAFLEIRSTPGTPVEKIAFISSRDGNNEIYLANADGSDPINLTNNPSNDQQPHISPDGSKIAFISNREGDFDIYVMNSDGSNQTRLTNATGNDVEPAFSPDGNKIVFMSRRNENRRQIYIMNADGSDQTRLTNNSAQDREPTFSPDGEKIAFTSDRDGNQEVYVMSTDGSNQINLTNFANGDDFQPAFSPDGSQIAFVGLAGGFEIFTMGSDGSGQVQLTFTQGKNRVDNENPAYSDDGTKIYFDTNRNGNDEIYSMNEDGTNAINLTNNPGVDFDPDSGFIFSSSTFVVTKTADTDDGICDADCSLREAIAVANDGDTISFSGLFHTPQTITLNGTQLSVNKELTIQGPDANLLAISGNNVSRVFETSGDTTITLIGMTIRDGNADSGGGISNTANLIMHGCVITNNKATESGGGLYSQGNNTLIVNETTISNNTATLDAGGFLSFSNTNVRNSTISGNQAERDVGGILFSTNTLDVINTTIANNTASNIIGGIENQNGTVNVKSSIIARNNGGLASDFSGTLTSQGYNLIGNTANTTIVGDTTGNKLNIDPKLAPLGNYGGSTPTHALLPGSPAIDAGRNFENFGIDQRRSARIFDFPGVTNAFDASDMGSFERRDDDFSGASAPFDFDGDGKSDVSIFRPGPNPAQYWILRSSDLGNNAYSFGLGSDKPVPADYTGDGKTDLAFFRESTSEWFVLRSEDSSFYSFPFGAAGDIPAPGDFDGDGIADVAVFRPATATWFINNSSGGTTIVGFGISEDKPVVADYDGDGKDDIAIYRPSNSQWWLNRSTDGVIVYQFGTTGDKTVQGDYTGDGKADVAFFRPNTSEWFVIRSEDQSFFGFPFGTNGDIPVPGDYDGDGQYDASVFRPSTTTWFLNGSTSGTQILGFGFSDDIPLANSFVRE